MKGYRFGLSRYVPKYLSAMSAVSYGGALQTALSPSMWFPFATIRSEALLIAIKLTEQDATP